MADNKYGGMTVNERLYVSGLIHDFYKAFADRDGRKIISILREVELTDGNINPILKDYGLLTIDQIESGNP